LLVGIAGAVASLASSPLLWLYRLCRKHLAGIERLRYCVYLPITLHLELERHQFPGFSCRNCFQIVWDHWRVQ
jgi:hypothetical protein